MYLHLTVLILTAGLRPTDIYRDWYKNANVDCKYLFISEIIYLSLVNMIIFIFILSFEYQIETTKNT